MADRKFAIRFSVEDMEKVRAALKNMGDDGASALRAIERQSRQATPGLKALDTAAKDIRREFDAFANRIPVIGGALSALGPVGTGVAAALGGIVLGFNAMANASRQAMDDIGRLKDASDRLNLSVTDLQSIRGAGMLSGIDAESMDSMLATLATNSARASEGFGKMKAALDRVNPELSLQLATTTSQAERMDILARATQEAATYNEKLNIAVAAFGTEGGKMIAMLDESGAAIETWKDRARGAGLVLEEDFVRAVDFVADRLDVARARAEVAGQRFAVAMAPLAEWLETAKGDQAQGWAFLMSGDPMKAIPDQSTAYLANELGKAKARRQTMIDRGVPEESSSLDYYDTRIAETTAELQKRYAAEKVVAEAASAKAAEEQLIADGEAFGVWLENWYVGLQKKTNDAAEKARQEAEKRAAEAARLREQQEKAAIEVRASLGDWTGKYAAEEERLNTLVAAGVLSREAMNASLAKTRGELDGSTAAVERWKAMVAASLTPVQQAEAALAAFEAEVRKFGDRAGVNELAIRAGLVDAINDAKDAAREATPEFKAVADARAAITAEAERLMTNQQKLDAYEAKQRALIGVNGYTWGEATKAIAAYRAELERASQTQRENTFELRFSAEVLTGIIDENINSLEDLGKVALRVFRQMAVEWILSNQKMAASQGIFDFIGNAITSAFTGGGAPAGGGSSPHATVGVKHSGGIIGSTPVNTRTVNGAMFIGAPRAHTGLETLRPGERPIIAEDGERMLSRVDNARVVRAIERGAGDGPRVELHFHGAEGKPEVRESRGADGSIRLDVMMKRAALDAIASSEGAKVLSSHYGLNRAVRGG